ncbi:MAG TPA: sulfotransferase [Armatimonadota bacterium]|jgi:hypothetical protein
MTTAPRLPNFIVIGTARAGTTALYHALRQHPQVYMSPVKEPRFFAYDRPTPNYAGPLDHEVVAHSILEPGAYALLFEGAGGARAVGEATPLYLTMTGAAKRIATALPGVRLIALLRQPADRAWSHYLLNVRQGIEPLRSFRQALSQEESRVRALWSPRWWYQRRGHYDGQVRAYLNHFGPDRIRFYRYEDWRHYPLEVWRDLCAFLEVDKAFVPTFETVNASAYPRLWGLHRAACRLRSSQLAQRSRPARAASSVFWRAYRKCNLVRPPRLDPEIRDELTQGYSDSILRTQDLIGLDLSGWLVG